MQDRGSRRADALKRVWAKRSGWAPGLLPLSWAYGALVAARKWLYGACVLKTYRAQVPVIVVGNVVAGGSGKTPVAISVIEHLQKTGWSPGVVSRGYGRSTKGLQLAQNNPRDAALVGDEPALIARRCSVPVAVAEQRSDAAAALLTRHPEVNILVCDDGLQHLALARDIEICVWNSAGAGNGWLLPAGPLREPWPRPVDLVVFAGAAPPPSPAPAYPMQRRLASYAITSDGEALALTGFAQAQLCAGVAELWAVAGTARPDEFFAMLRDAGLALAGTTALPDHFNFDSWKPINGKRYRLICTEKDAVKLWPRFPGALAVRLELAVDGAFFPALDARLAALQGF